jgi:tripartite-type tricarboxylate transporter receptor subunit TctC
MSRRWSTADNAGAGKSLFCFRRAFFVFLACFSLLMTIAQSARAQSDFYTGKAITVVVGFSAGTGYDIYARLFARYLPRHLEGRPAVVTQNMPGAGSFTAASHLYNMAPRDGTVLGMIDQASPLSQTLGTPGFRADVSRFNWIGRLTGNAAVLFARSNAGFSDMRETFGREMIISANGQNSRIMTAVMKNLLGLKLRILTGYQSSAESQLALQRSEVEAMTLPWSVLRSERPSWLAEKYVTLLMQMGAESHPELTAVPLVTSLARNAEEEKVLTLVSNDSRVGRSVMAPPGLAPDRLAKLRRAFMDAIGDPDLLEEARRTGLDIAPMDGAALQDMIRASVQVDPSVAARVKAIIDLNQ